MNRNKHSAFFIFFTITILVFLWRLITLRGLFIHGDNFVQFYPWFKFYAESIKSFYFPFWCRYMQSGFPLMAEGQTGGFYPLNILMFLLLPLRIAYNYSVILHFILGGVFTYLYTRKLGADQAGGYLAALLFCFGSAYAGCFYNIVTLKTLAWFPLVLLLFELYFDKQKLRYIIFAGVILGFQLLAGFIQMAIYSGIFYMAYFIYKAKIERQNPKNAVSAILIFAALSFIISLPQIILTYQLVNFSGREGASLGFALWRSYPPMGLLGLIFPYSIHFANAHFYIGIFSLFFVLSCFYLLKQEVSLRPVVLVLILSIFFALGRYNPLYVAALKLTGFYSFRNPSKFLFFGAFALSVLAGWGLTNSFETHRIDREKRSSLIFRWLLLVCGSLFLISKVLFHLFKNQIIEFGSWYVRNFVYNKPYHRYSLDYYLEKVALIYNNIADKLSFSNIFVISSWLLLIVAVVLLPIMLRKRLKHAVVLLIFLDIFIFSFYGTGFRKEIRPFDELKPDNPKILDSLKSDSELYRILPFDIKSQKLPNWSLPNANIIYGIDSVACYTPLASRAYRDRLLGLEVVDDSLGLKTPKKEALKPNLHILRLLNVKYIISHKELNQNFLDMVEEQDGVFLYQLKGHLPRAFFTDDIDSPIKARAVKRLKIIEYKSGLLKVEVSTGRGGFLVFSEGYYPGWSVSVDGINRELIEVKGLVQAVEVDKGDHLVIFRFKPNPGLLTTNDY